MIGSYTGDYLWWTDEQLVDELRKPALRHSLGKQIESDLRQVILWRMKGDPAGWPEVKGKKVRLRGLNDESFRNFGRDCAREVKRLQEKRQQPRKKLGPKPGRPSQKVLATLSQDVVGINQRRAGVPAQEEGGG